MLRQLSYFINRTIKSVAHVKLNIEQKVVLSVVVYSVSSCGRLYIYINWLLSPRRQSLVKSQGDALTLTCLNVNNMVLNKCCFFQADPKSHKIVMVTILNFYFNLKLKVYWIDFAELLVHDPEHMLMFSGRFRNPTWLPFLF